MFIPLKMVLIGIDPYPHIHDPKHWAVGPASIERLGVAVVKTCSGSAPGSAPTGDDHLLVVSVVSINNHKGCY